MGLEKLKLFKFLPCCHQLFRCYARTIWKRLLEVNRLLTLYRHSLKQKSLYKAPIYILMGSWDAYDTVQQRIKLVFSTYCSCWIPIYILMDLWDVNGISIWTSTSCLVQRMLDVVEKLPVKWEEETISNQQLLQAANLIIKCNVKMIVSGFISPYDTVQQGIKLVFSTYCSCWIMRKNP